MTLVIHFEIGHDASLRTKTTPEGFTHDWEVFVRGCGGAEIHHYIEKVVFHLHETFPKPKRVVKEPPFSLRTSGYAGFTLPIDIYLRNNQEPKKIGFNYELVLQPSGPPIHKVQKEKYVFPKPSDEFRNRLLKGGAVVTSSGGSQENATNSNKVVDKNQMTSKPRLSGSDVKKHKMKLDEPKNSDFLNLFGTPITKMSKSLEYTKPKEPPKPAPKQDPKVSGDKDKEKCDKNRSSKSSHKDRDKEKEKSKDRSSESTERKNKEDKKKSKDEKSKERERSKEKSSKKERDKERERSPRPPSHSPSPKRSPKRSSSPLPAPPKIAPIKEKDYYKEDKKEKDDKRDKKEEKKPKKDKRDHKDKHKDRDKEKEYKEHKNKESKLTKDIQSFKSKDASPITVPQAGPQVVNKVEKKDKIKEKESPKESPKEEERTEKSRSEKLDDKSQKHKHKKKDRKDKREERHTKSEKKSEKQSNSMNKFKDLLKEPAPLVNSRESDKNNLFGSPKSEPPSTPDQESHKPVNNAPFKDDDSSMESTRGSSREPSPIHKALSRSPSPMEIESVKKLEPEKVKVKEESPKKKEKKEKKKDKKSDKDHDKKRKRKSENATQEISEPLVKVMKEEENNNSDDESKVSSTEDINPIPKSECDMDMLRDLQHKIMSLKDNADLQKVVQLIAETGQYEVSANTFDFDLCLLDKSTVKQLQDFFSTVS